MRSFTLRTLWKRPETLRILMARRRWIERLAGIDLGVKGVRRGVAKAAEIAVDAVGGMGGIGIVARARRCPLVRTRRWKSRVVLRRAAMRRLRMRGWKLRLGLVGKRKRLARVLRVRTGSAGGVVVADGGGDVGLRVRRRARLQLRRVLGLRLVAMRMSLVLRLRRLAKR